MAEIKCYKLTENGLKLVGVVDDYTSFVFTRKYSDIGEWQLVINALSENAKLIKDINFISNGDGVAGIVKKVVSNIGTDNTIIYSGVELKGIINQRIVMPPSNSSHLSVTNTAPEVVIANIIDKQLINCDASQRNIPFIRLADYSVIPAKKIDYNGRFTNAYDDITTIATANNIGWYADIQPIEDNKQYAEIVYHIYSGLDRSINQSTNSRLVLSFTNDNMASTTYEANNGVPTTALVAGQGEGVERAVVKINDATIGLDRNEIYVDARDIEDDTLLPQRGQEALAEYGDTASYQITFNQLLIERYRKDFELGDIGTVDDEVVGGIVDFRLTEITEIYEQGSYNIDVVFGYDRQSLGDALRRSNSNTNTLLKVEGITGGGSGNVDAGTIEGKTISDLLLMMYPIGSIYMSAASANPNTIFGGTWVSWGTGKVPVGIDTNQTEFDTVEKTGGAKTHTLAVNEMPSHTHVQDSHNHTQNSHNHTQNSHNHTQNSHTHADTFAVASGGAHTHQASTGSYKVGSGSGSTYKYKTDNGTADATNTNSAGAHTHTLNGAVSSATATNNEAIATNVAATAINNATTATNQNTGGGQSHNNLQPYITCYMWKRTA